jgi:membrane fusion protein (multidrug efflux system)
MTLGALASGCEQEVQPPEPPIVVVSPAEKKDVPIFREYVGVTKASLDVEIRARVDGFLEEQLLVEGSAVEKGDLLYRIDNRRYQARVNRIEASLASDRAVLAKARRDVERLRPLYEQNAASQLDFDNAVSAVEQGKAAVAATDAELEEAQLELSYTEIRAPIFGMAGASQVDIGSLVGSGGQSLLTTVKQIDPIFVTFNMSALDYLNARRRMRTLYEKAAAEEKGKALQGWVHITLPDDSEYRYRGDVSFTDPQVSPETGTFAVRAVLPNPDHELLPGQYTRTRIKLEELPNAVVIPEQTLKIEQGGAYVMVLLANDTVEQRFVITGPRVKGQVVINSGLAAGERVVVEGMHRVRHGQKVTPQTLEEYEEHKAQQQQERLKAAEEKAQPS